MSHASHPDPAIIKLQEEIARLKRENEEIKLASTSKKKSKNSPSNSQLVMFIHGAIRNYGFKQFKFVTDEDGENRLCECVMNHIDIAGLVGDGDAVRISRQNFQRDNMDIVTAQLNEMRNCVPAQMKTVAYKYMDGIGKPELPPIRDLLACVYRKLDLKVPTNKALAIWWVDKLMPTFSANKKEFGPKLCYYEPISVVKSNPDAGYLDITPETEAFGFVVLESNHRKWPTLWDLERKHPASKGTKTIIMKAKKKNKKKVKDVRYFYLTEHPNLATIFTKPDAGQEKFGGWLEAGIEQFIKLKQIITKVRAKLESQAWKTELSHLLWIEHGITGKDHEEQLKVLGKNQLPWLRAPAWLPPLDSLTTRIMTRKLTFLMPSQSMSKMHCPSNFMLSCQYFRVVGCSCS